MIKFDFDKLADASLQLIGTVATEEAKKNMATVSHGRTYIIGGKKHIASKRGDAPNNLSGNLSKSLRYEMEGHRHMKFGGGGGNVDYLKYLEGTLFRPNIDRSVLAHKDKLDAAITIEFKRALGM